MKGKIILLFSSLLLGSCFADHPVAYQNVYTYGDKGCFRQPLKVHATQITPQCQPTTEGPPFSISFCDVLSQEYVTQECGSDSTCSNSNCQDSAVFSANNCSYYDDYFHPNTELNCTEDAPMELLSVPNTFAQVSFNNRKCSEVPSDIYDIKVYYLGEQNCYDSYTDYNDFDSTYYTCTDKAITQYTCRGPGCKKGCNETAVYDVGCKGTNGLSVQYICNPPTTGEEPCLDGCPEQKEEEPCLDGCPEQKEEEPCLDGCPEQKEEEPCLDGCPAKEEPCLDGCPEQKEEEPCLDGCPEEKEEEPCLDGCPAKEEPCLDGCPEEKEDPCLDGCPKEKEDPCLDGCPEEKEDPCLDGCPEEKEDPCLDGCPEEKEDPCLDGCPEEKEDPCLDGCPEEKEEPCLDGCPEEKEDPCLDGCPAQ